jgi:hypothetical protein
VKSFKTIMLILLFALVSNAQTNSDRSDILVSINTNENYKHLRYIKHPLLESNSEKKFWRMHTTDNLPAVPTVVRERLNYQIYFFYNPSNPKYTEPYIDAAFIGDSIYFTLCRAKMYFDNPYGVSLNGFIFLKTQCKNTAVKISINKAREKLINNSIKITLELITPKKSYDVAKSVFDIVHDYTSQALPKEPSRAESAINNLFEIDTTIDRSLNGLVAGVTDSALNLFQDTLNLAYLHSIPEKNTVVAVENFNDLKKDLKRLILDLNK